MIMALNIKTLMPKEHPEVTYPEKSLKSSASSSREEYDLEKNQLEEKAFADEAKRLLAKVDLKKRINIIR
ncbi:MAG: hypothetical protein Fur0010_16720 [Bdellovibrio sp.]